MREAAIRRFLEALGVERGRIYSERGWVNAPCPLAPYTHAGGHDSRPSFGVHVNDDGASAYWCLAGETRVITDRGTFPISELVGGRHRILTTGGVWVEVSFQSYGVQRLYEVELTRNGTRKRLYATREHRWFTSRWGRRDQEWTTETLPIGRYLTSCVPQRVELGNIDQDAIRRGYIFGDGCISGRIGQRVSQADLYGPDNEFMVPFYEECDVAYYECPMPDGKGPLRKTYRGFEQGWKQDMPAFHRPPEYLAGWLAGLIAADGCVDDDGLVILNSSRPEVLQYVRDLSCLLGIVTFGISEQMRVGINQNEESAIYRINFARETFPDMLLLKPSHIEKFRNAGDATYTRLKWKVASVSKTDRVEDVFCCEVPETHAFTLEDFILTGNCFGCSPKGRGLGRLLHNMFVADGRYPHAAARIYAQEELFHVTDDDENVEAPDRWVKKPPRQVEPLPREVLAKYPLLQNGTDFEARRLKQWLENDRGVPEWVQNLCRLRYNYENQSVVFPMTDIRGNVFVLRERCRKEKKMWTISPKLAGMPDAEFPKLKEVGVWFGMQLVDWSSPVMLVEGEIDAMRLMALGFLNVIASCTSSVTDAQLDALTGDTFILGQDADKGGDFARSRCIDRLKDRATLFSVSWVASDCKDPGELQNKDQLTEVLDQMEAV